MRHSTDVFQEGLYQQARAGNGAAWSRLQTSTVSRLARWLISRQGVALPVWEIQEISLAAWEEAMLRNSRITRWPQLYGYARRAAMTQALKRLAASHGATFVHDGEAALANTVDRRWYECTLRTDFYDELGALVSKLQKQDIDLLLVLARAALDRKFTLGRAATRLTVSLRTLKRRLCHFRQRLYQLRNRSQPANGRIGL